MKHSIYHVEVWKRGGCGLVLRAEPTDCAERAQRMALEMRAANLWYVSVIVEHPDGVRVVGEHDLDRLVALVEPTGVHE